MELPSQGESFQRKYKLHEVLGKGGFAAVYRATDVEIGRDVAIKVLAPSDDGYSKGIESRFMREARVIASLQDPHTITMFEFGRSDEGLLFMVFEYVRGLDLSLLIRRNPLTEPATIHILQQVLQSLREAHAAGVLHRDLKPANILIYEYMDDEFRAKLLDFGIAKPVAGGGDGLNLTSDGAMIGTPRYMAPEQIYGGDLSPGSDIYSLGLVAYEMLVGQPAITGRTTKDMMVQQLSDDPVQLPPTLAVSPPLRNVINRMTARDPAQRFANADQVLQALEFVEASNSGAIQPPSGPNPAWSSGAHQAHPSQQYPTGNYTPPQQQYPTGGGQRFPTGTGQGPYPTGAGPNPYPPGQGQYPTGPGQPSPYGPQGPHGTAPPGASGVHRSWTDRSLQSPSTQRELTAPGVKDSNWALAAGGLAAGAGIVALLMGINYLMADKPESPAVQPVRKKVTIVAADTGPTPAVPTADAGAATAADASDAQTARMVGCGTKAGWEHGREFTVATDSGRRRFTVYVPTGYDENKKNPVVMLFHKAFNDGKWIAKDSNIKPIAEKHNFVYMAFDAADKTQPWSDRDLSFIELALDETERAVCVDRGRVFAVGHGAGGDFVRDVACALPVAGIATVGSGEIRGMRTCKPGPPVPYIRMAGMDDRYLPPAGGSGCLGGNVKSLEEVEEQWRGFNLCEEKRTTWRKNRHGVCYGWKCEASFVSCRVDGGHDWPNSTPEKFEMPGCPFPPPKFKMMEAIWDFFAEQPAVDWKMKKNY